jgi:hypothetical protein
MFEKTTGVVLGAKSLELKKVEESGAAIKQTKTNKTSSGEAVANSDRCARTVSPTLKELP